MIRTFSDGHPKVLPACNFLSQYYFHNIFLQKSCRFSLQTLTKFEAAKIGSGVGFLRLTAVCTVSYNYACTGLYTILSILFISLFNVQERLLRDLQKFLICNHFNTFVCISLLLAAFIHQLCVLPQLQYSLIAYSIHYSRKLCYLENIHYLLIV